LIGQNVIYILAKNLVAQMLYFNDV